MIGTQSENHTGFLTFRCGHLLLLTSIACSGCGSDKTGRVSGRVTLDGAPVANVTVVFQSDVGHTSIGVTDRNGHYELDPPAVVGTYRVTLETYRIMRDDQDNLVEHPETLPARYNRDSKLAHHVAAGADNRLRSGKPPHERYTRRIVDRRGVATNQPRPDWPARFRESKRARGVPTHPYRGSMTARSHRTLRRSKMPDADCRNHDRQDNC